MRENGRSERLKSGADAQPYLSDVYKNGTRAKRRQADVTLCGRSMVEMLGVLAIIGVLSVGAMTEYSKAMLKYKLNKQAEAMTILLNNAMQLRPDFPETGDEYYAQLLSKLNLLPDGIELQREGSAYLTDIFGALIWFYGQSPYYGIGYRFDIGGSQKEICANLLNVYKTMHSEIYYIVTDGYSINEDGEEQKEDFGHFYGDAYCEGDNCLYNMSLNDIDMLCHQCTENSTKCRLYVTWK